MGQRLADNEWRRSTPPRAFGIENELTSPMPDDNIYMDSVVPEEYQLTGSPSSVWLTTGGRVLVDCSMLELNSPECASPREAALHEKVNERLGAIIINNMHDLDDPSAPAWHTYKRSGYIDIQPPGESSPVIHANSTGQHENYSTNAGSMSNQAIAGLVSYLYTREAWAGAGIVTYSGLAPRQRIGATEFSIKSVFSGTQTQHGYKTPFMDHDPFGRVEVRSGDGNMSPWVITQKLGLTSLVMRLVEHDIFPDEYLIHESLDYDFFKANLYNPHKPHRALQNRLSPIQHQRGIVVAALEFADRHDVPTYEIEAAANVIQTLGQIEAYYSQPENPELLAAISDRLDFAAKIAHINQITGRHHTPNEITANTMRNVMHDLQWEECGPNTPSERWYAAHGNMFTEAEIAKAMVTPPNTRAAERSDLISEYWNYGVNGIDWDYVDYGFMPTLGSKKLPNPLGKNL